MAKKKKSITIHPSAVKLFFVVILSLVVGLGICKGVVHLLTHSDYFKIKAVIIDPSLAFIDRKDFADLTGKNIFTVDLSKMYRKFSFNYPQVSQLKIIRQFPNQLYVAAKERVPVAQAKIHSRYYTFDSKGVVLSSAAKQDNNLPIVIGVELDKSRVNLGLPINNPQLQAALQILSSYRENKDLQPYQVNSISVENLSKMLLVLSNKLEVIVDREKIDQKFHILGFVLSQGKLNMNEVKYIDLRFKEPIIGKK